jgi:putative ATP-dependent endonuclease of OLD family
MSLLQQLTTGSSARLADTDMPERAETLQELPSYMMVIEEPELHQHPDRQRHFKHVFSDLSLRAIEGVSNATQVCYCTHSPLFVDMGRFDSVRLCRKTAGRSSDAPRQTQVVHASVDDIRKALSSQETLERLQSKLQTIMTPVMNEGFFAHAIVLVEGDDDRGAILGTARHLGYDLESMGVAVIPCTGKNNIDRAWAVFKTLGTPVYVVWDNDRSRCTYPTTCDCSQCHSKSDCKAHASTNERLLKILGQTPVGQLGQKVQDTYACFENNLESTIKDDLTAVLYEELLQEVVAELGTQEDEHPIKNPAVICEILERAAQRNKPCSTLEAIVKRVLKMVDLPRA